MDSSVIGVSFVSHVLGGHFSIVFAIHMTMSFIGYAFRVVLGRIRVDVKFASNEKPQLLKEDMHQKAYVFNGNESVQAGCSSTNIP